jgi:hypothetical protein
MVFKGVFVIYLIMTPLVRFSKHQPTVESSVFGAEFIAIQNWIATSRGLHNKLRMVGVPLSCPTYVYGGNLYVVHNIQCPEYVLKKKSK